MVLNRATRHKRDLIINIDDPTETQVGELVIKKIPVKKYKL